MGAIVSEPKTQERDDGQQHDNFLSPQPPRPQEPYRKEDIKLLLDPQTPRMQQRLELCRDIEVITLVPKKDIGRKHQDRHRAFRKLFRITRHEPQPGNGQTHRHDHV